MNKRPIGEKVPQTRTILAIDDDPMVLNAVEEFLNTREYKVVTAQRWTDAIDQLANVSPDAVLLDLHMPTVQGEALLEFIRENYAALPVIIISAGATPAEMSRLGELGANGFIRKPFDTEDLIVILEQVLLDLETNTEPLPDPTRSYEIEQPQEQPIDMTDEDEEDEEDDEEDHKKTYTPVTAHKSQLPPGISPGSGIQNLVSMQPKAPQQEIRRRRKKKRTGVRKVTRLRKIRNLVVIILIFLGLGYGIFLSQKGLDSNFIGGITFGAPKPE